MSAQSFAWLCFYYVAFLTPDHSRSLTCKARLLSVLVFAFPRTTLHLDISVAKVEHLNIHTFGRTRFDSLALNIPCAEGLAQRELLWIEAVTALLERDNRCIARKW